MQLTNAEIEYFVNNRLKLVAGKRSEYLAQVDHLIEQFKAKADKTPHFGIKKFLKTGSLRKGTVLRPRDGFGVDADIAVYLKPGETKEFDLDTLHDTILELLISIYPSKKSEDFKVQPRTLGISFNTSGLEVDLVPILPIDGPDDFGWQPSSRGEPPVKTSVSKQLEFIRSYKNGDTRFRSLVRLLKHWRNYQELDDSLRSFSIELIVCHLQKTRGAASTLEEGLLRFFLYIASTELREAIYFTDDGKQPSLPNERVVLLDPVNLENNVGRKLTEDDCTEIVSKATEAWEILTTASNNNYKGETLEYWKQIFGRSFVIEE
jgi:tRNA nucleotidyltransferase (CCA-adding enzyme)